jgi:hypothetical protein
VPISLQAVVLPVAIVASGAVLYDGIRHLLFIIPPLVGLSAMGWLSLLESRARWVRVTAVALLVGGVAEPVGFSLRNHPHQVVYFNPLLGGPRQATGRFELDYWGNCLYPAQRRVAAMAIRAGMPIAVSGHRWRQMGANAGRLPQLVVRRPELAAHHLEIVLHRGSVAQVRQMIGRGDILDRIETADGATLCSVVPGPVYAELAGRLCGR